MSDSPVPHTGEILLYRTEDGRTRVECHIEGETLWLTQAQMAELFQVTVPTINEHIKGIYEEEESTGEDKVPLLGDVPVLGYLFKSQSRVSSRKELLVFITPRIVSDALTLR